MKKAPLRVAIIVDPFGGMDKEGPEEIEDHKKHLRRVFSKRALNFETPSYVSDQLRADLVIFDFGGMSTGNDLLASNSRRLVRWMVDHPSSLVLIASTFTYNNGVCYELEELGIPVSRKLGDDAPPPIPNLLVGYCHGDIGYGDKLEAQLAEWFKEPKPKRVR